MPRPTLQVLTILDEGSGELHFRARLTFGQSFLSRFPSLACHVGSREPVIATEQHKRQVRKIRRMRHVSPEQSNDELSTDSWGKVKLLPSV